MCSSKIPETQIGTGAGSLTRTWGSSFTTKRTVQYEPYNSQNTEDAIYRFSQKMMSEGTQDIVKGSDSITARDSRTFCDS